MASSETDASSGILVSKSRRSLFVPRPPNGGSSRRAIRCCVLNSFAVPWGHRWTKRSLWRDGLRRPHSVPAIYVLQDCNYLVPNRFTWVERLENPIDR
jgi:hypothetical protein